MVINQPCIVAYIINVFASFNMALVLVVRKLAHIFLYTGLFILTYVNFKTYFKNNTIIKSLVFCVLIAFVDETIQHFNPGRNGNILDVVIDSFGIGLGLILYLMVQYLKRIFKRGV